MRWRQVRPDWRLIEIKTVPDLAHQIRNGFEGKLHNEIEIMRGARDTPIVACHRTGEQVCDASTIEPADGINGKLLLRHKLCASAIRSRKSRSTSSALASGC